MEIDQFGIRFLKESLNFSQSQNLHLVSDTGCWKRLRAGGEASSRG